MVTLVSEMVTLAYERVMGGCTVATPIARIMISTVDIDIGGWSKIGLRVTNPPKRHIEHMMAFEESLSRLNSTNGSLKWEDGP